MLSWKGTVRATVFHENDIVLDSVFQNLITDAGLALFAHLLDGVTVTGEGIIKYMAVGTDATPPTPSDTKLGAELFRKQLTTQTFAGPGSVDSAVYLSPSEGVGSIREIGWFAGPDATAASDSGLMIARVLYSHDKTALESINLDRIDTIGRA